MPIKRWRFLLLTLVVLSGVLLFIIGKHNRVEASVSSCTASASPNSVAPSTTNSFSITVNNTSSSTINWMRIFAPSSYFTINSATTTGWSNSLYAGSLILTSGTLSSSDTFTFTVSVTTGSSLSPSADWEINASDDAGSATTQCDAASDGSLGTAIEAVTPTPTPTTAPTATTAPSATSAA